MLQLAERDNWDEHYPDNLAYLAKSVNERGDSELAVKMRETAISLAVSFDPENAVNEYNSPIDSPVETLALFAKFYGQSSDTAGLREIAQAAKRIAPSDTKQKLLGAISKAYALHSVADRSTFDFN